MPVFNGLNAGAGAAFDTGPDLPRVGTSCCHPGRANKTSHCRAAGANAPLAGGFASARVPGLVTIPRLMCGAAREAPLCARSGLPCPGSAFDPGSGARREAMRIFRHPGWSMVMVGFLGLTAHGQEGAQVQNNSAPAAANAVAATANGQPILEAALQRRLKRLPPEKQAGART